MKRTITAIALIAILFNFGLPGSGGSQLPLGGSWGLPSGGGWGLPLGGGWGLPSGGGWGFPNAEMFSFGGAPQAPAASRSLHAHRIVCVGDSMTEGFANPNNWPYQLKTRLGGNWDVIDQGVGGAKTADMVNRTHYALSLHPGFVIIMGGINDLANGEVPLATVQANIRTMCDLADSHGAVPVLCTVPPTNFHLAQQDVLNAWIAEYAHLKGYPLIDFYTVIDDPLHPGYSNPALVMSDGEHPNAAGYVAMGNAIDLTIFTGGS